MSDTKKPTIADLEALLNGPEPCIEIMPDGSLKAKGHLAEIQSLRTKNSSLLTKLDELGREVEGLREVMAEIQTWSTPCDPGEPRKMSMRVIHSKAEKALKPGGGE